jgi:galactonate dehydratase
VKVTSLKTLRLGEFPNLCFVLVTTDEGLTGLGETFFGSKAVASWVHETAAPYLLGQDALDIERHSSALRPFVGFAGTGVENRGRAAVDIALWDLLGQATGAPLYRLLGGRSRERVRLYNTCAGPTYVRQLPRSPNLPTSNWSSQEGCREGSRYADLQMFLTDAGRLAEDLLAEGITAMKIWPFDLFAESSGGHWITPQELRSGIEPFAKVRNSVGRDMELMVEMHSKWDLPVAVKIAKALEEFEPTWFEDPIRMDCTDALAAFAQATTVPTAASETVAAVTGFRDLIEHGGVRIVLVDPAWVGGITEARKVLALAEARHLPVAPHDCVGPVNFVVGTHMTVSAPNAFIQEGVRAFYRGWYRDIVTDLPTIENGWISPPEAPGLGTALRPDVWLRADAVVEMSELQ